MLRGQVNLHFIVSVVIFLGVVIYLIHVLLTSSSFYREDVESDILYAKAYQVSELLIKDKGYPANWNETNFDRIGLVSEHHLLNQSKINEFEKICSSTTDLAKIQRLRDSFGLESENLVVEINYLNNTNVIKCKPTGKKVGTTAYIKRIATLNNNFVEVKVYVG